MVMTILTIPADAQELHADLCLYGCPSGSPATNDVVIRDIYILSSNDTTKFADWVAYRVTESTIGATAGRVWKPDPWLADTETLEPKDYKGAFAALKTDRGHQTPLASFTSTPNWEATNYLSNITPQKSAGASAIKCCYAAAGSGSGAEETGLRAPVSRKTSIRDHKGIVVAKKMSRKVSRRVVRPACIAGVRISRPNFRAPCGRTKL